MYNWGLSESNTCHNCLTHCGQWCHRKYCGMFQLMACCLMAPDNYLNQLWLINTNHQWYLMILWHSPEGNFTGNTNIHIQHISLIALSLTGDKAFGKSNDDPAHSALINWCMIRHQCVDTLRPRQNGCHFPNDIFKMYFLEWKCMNFD